MNKTILKRIANSLALNIQQTPMIGLLEGNLSMALYLYHYAKSNNLKSYSDMADSILDYTIEHYLKNVDRSFSSGLYGIGWTIWYMKRHCFVEISDDTFDDFETIVKQPYSSIDIDQDLNTKFPVFSKGLYCVQSGKPENFEYALKAIDIIREYKEKTLFTSCYLNSIIYVLKRIEESNCEKRNLDLNKAFLYSVIQETPSIYTNDDYNLYIAKQMNPTLFQQVELSDKFNILECGYMNWQSIIYKKYVNLPDLHLSMPDNMLIDDIINNASISRMSLNGIASLGINLIVNSRNGYQE